GAARWPGRQPVAARGLRVEQEVRRHERRRHRHHRRGRRGRLRLAQGHIEGDDATTSPTIKGFTDKYGVKVTYESNIDGNDTFTTKYQPDLEAGRGIGADLIVLTSWMAAQYVENGWVEEWPAGYF